MKRYDLVLVLGYFRSAAAFLSIIRHLSGEFRIGIIPLGDDPSLTEKTGQAHLDYLRLCIKFGADIVDLNTPISAGLMLVQQFPYPDSLAERVLSAISSDHRVGMMTLAMAGIEKHDRFLAQFDIRKIYVPSLRLMKFLIMKRQAEMRYANVSMEEVGLPFRAYPIFDGPTMDWLIATPTLFSFHSEKEKQEFLKTVIQLLAQVPKNDLVVYKPHNGNSRDYFAPRVHYAIARAMRVVPGMERLINGLVPIATGVFLRQLDRLVTCFLHLQVLKRAKPLAQHTSHADISLEAFLPLVRKGVIGGLSNTIWGTLFFGLQYFNCVSATGRQGESELLNKKSDTLLDLNLEYFGVPPCGGKLAGGAHGDGIVQTQDRQGDLVASIKCQLGFYQ